MWSSSCLNSSAVLYVVPLGVIRAVGTGQVAGTKKQTSC